MTEKEVHSPAVLCAEIVARAKAGDREALGQIYEATSTEIYRTIHAMVRDEQTVLDIQQDVYVQAFSHLDQLREPDSLRPWLRQIAVNRVRLQFRAEKPLLFTELSSEDDGPVPDFPDLHEEGAPALELEKKETARLVRQILDKLSDGQRLLIGMYYYEQMPVKKIAENLGISEGAVKVQLYRGRKKVETEVRRLEEEGVKLYGLSPLPFVVALLRRLVPMERAEKAVFTGALERSGAAAALQTTLPFFQSALGRVVIGLGIAAAIGGGIAGGRWLNSHRAVRHDAPTSENVLRINAGDPTLPSDRTGPAQPTGPDLPVDPTETEIAAHEAPTAPVVTEPPATAPGASQPAPPEAGGPGAEDGNSDPGIGFLGWRWGDFPEEAAGDRGDFEPPHEYYLHVSVHGDPVPEVYTDHPEVVALRFSGKTTPEGYVDYSWGAKYQSPGVAHIYCRINGETVAQLTVDNPTYTPALSSVEFFSGMGQDGTLTYESAAGSDLNDIMMLSTLYCGPAYHDGQIILPEIVTDRPDLLLIEEYEGNDQVYTHPSYDIRTLKKGTAHIMIQFDGVTVKTYTVNILHDQPKVLSCQWVAAPDAPSDRNDLAPGDSDILRVTVQGIRVPTLYPTDSQMIQVDSLGRNEAAEPDDEEIRVYEWRVTVLAPGTAELHLCLDTIIRIELTVNAE